MSPIYAEQRPPSSADTTRQIQGHLLEVAFDIHRILKQLTDLAENLIKAARTTDLRLRREHLRSDKE